MARCGARGLGRRHPKGGGQRPEGQLLCKPGGVPLLLAIPYLYPTAALLAVFCGQLAAQLQNRRPPAKALINCLTCSVSMSLGIFLYDRGLGQSPPWSMRGWLVAAVSFVVVSFVDLVGVVAAIGVLNWRWRPPPLRATLVHALFDVVICTVGGITAIMLMRVGIWDVALFAVLVVAADVGWRRAARAAQRHAALERLYTFTERLALVQGGVRELVTTVLDGARSLLSASRATRWWCSWKRRWTTSP